MTSPLTEAERIEIGEIICGNIQHSTEEMLVRIEKVLMARAHLSTNWWRDTLREDYPFRCEDCGRAHILDTVIPSEIWNKIAPDASMLCPLCIDARLTQHGLTCEARFYFGGKALSSRLYAEDTDPTPSVEYAPELLDAMVDLSKKEPAAQFPNVEDFKGMAPHKRVNHG